MPEEHTPTTDEARDCYVYGRWVEGPPERHFAEFDRWLAQVKAETLRDAADRVDAQMTHAYDPAGYNRRARESITLIRREADRIANHTDGSNPAS